MRRVVGLLALLTIAAGIAPARGATVSYSDLGKTPWARSAIESSAKRHSCMRGGVTLFGPTGRVTRGLLARAIILAFPEDLPEPCPPVPSPSVSPSPSPSPTTAPCVDPPPIVNPTFSDLAKSSPTYRFAAAAVRRKLMTVKSGNRFDASGTVMKAEMDRTLVRALEVPEAVYALDHIRTSDGYRFRHATQFAYGVIAADLHFHYNYPGTQPDLLPTTAVSRADFAYALNAAKTADGWRLWQLQSYDDLILPKMDKTRRLVVEFALKYAEYPYVWGGYSSKGMDCSGFVWWVLKKGIGPSSRGYAGWPLGPRTSFDMARTASPRLRERELRVMDILLFDVAGIGTTPAYKRAGHAGLYLGNGWYIHSSGSQGGVGIDRLGGGMDLLWGRRGITS